MDKFLETYNLLKLNQEEAENLSRLITTSEIEAVIRKLLAKKALNQMASQVNFTNLSKKNKYLAFSIYLIKFKRREGFQTHFSRPVLS